ncbi:hypothetical protein AaE_007098 [Aphanomyces astaci]|uniref:Uncharacterized protein n=1 Tax=Aphanomyces astaci TaxID=112090 RepID=A0A6A5AJ36_APHAT|nr:hypothetical protein AaE_007098 [Aphanomyces astaci]
MTTIAPTTQIFNDDIDATGVAQQRPRGERFHAGMTAVATAPTAETADSTGKHLRKMLCHSIHDALPVLEFFVVAASTRGIACIYILAAGLIMALDRCFRGFAETSTISRVCIALFCARTSFDRQDAYNGDATPLHTLFNPIQDSSNLADIIWAVMVKGAY